MSAGTSLIKLYPLIQKTKILTAVSRNYAVKSDLKIKWIKPERIPCYKPEKSGDLQQIPSIDSSQYRLEFRDCKELENADDIVKKLFTLEFAPRKESVLVYKKTLIDSIRNHPLDTTSTEARIARWTGNIRAWQELMEEFPRNRRLKVRLKELIDKRKKYLKFLRRWDYKKFEWLIENLNIAYKPEPSEYERVTRKGSMRKLTQKYCDGVVNDKLDAFKLKLQQEQPAFLQEKIRSLEFIRKEQKDCGVEVTIKQEDIDKTKELLDNLLKAREETVKEE